MELDEKLEQAIQDYSMAISHILLGGDHLLSETQVLRVLRSRDILQDVLRNTDLVSVEQLSTIEQLDQLLKSQAAHIASVHQSSWLKLFNPSQEAWWWFLKVTPNSIWEKYDWIYSILSIIFLTISVGLSGDISSRFLAGSSDLLGALTVSFQSLGNLLSAGSLTPAGQEICKRTLTKFKCSERYWHELSCGLSMLVLGAVGALRLSLPLISTAYSNHGFQQFEERNLGSAEKSYQRALYLNSDNSEAHFRLGLLYEELQKTDEARIHYLQAVQDDIPVAINNLARLHIQKKNYAGAVSLLTRTLDPKRNLKLDVPTQYVIHKNLGWARFLQGGYAEAEVQLLQAIELKKTNQIDSNLAAPHCLLAQVMEKQGDKKAPLQQATLQQWEFCNMYADSLNSDEDEWSILAQNRLQKVENQK